MKKLGSLKKLKNIRNIKNIRIRNVKNLKSKLKRPRFDNLRVGYRLVLGFMIVIIMTGLVGFVGIRGFSTISSANETKGSASDIMMETNVCRTLEQNYVNTHTDESIDNVLDKVAELKQSVYGMYRQVSDSDSTKILDAMSFNLAAYQTAFEEYVQASNYCDNIMTKWTTLGEGLNSKVEDIRIETGYIDPVYVQADKVETQFILMRVAAVYYTKTPSDTTWADFQNAMTATLAESETLSEMTEPNEQLHKCALLIDEYITAYRNQAETYEKYIEENLIIQNTMVECGDKVVGSADESSPYYGGAALLNAIADDKAGSAKSSAQTLMIAFIGGAIVFALAIAYLLQRGISKPINNVKMALQKMAVGDLSAEVKVDSRDEIGEMARSYIDMQTYMNEMATAATDIAGGDLTVTVNPKSSEDSLGNAFQKMVINLRNLIEQVQTNAMRLNTASGQLSSAADEAGKATQGMAATSQQLAKGAGEQAQNVQEVTKAVGQLSTAVGQIAIGAQEQSRSIDEASAIVSQVSKVVGEVARNAQNANDSSKQANDAAQEGMSAVNKTVEGMGKIKSSMDVVTGKITRLGERSAEIGKIVNVIEDIAAQTNLLALNAAIEAARAGDQGRGFAVVADEVRKLADRVATATKEISNLISAVRGGAADCMKATEEGSKEVAEGYKLADEAGQALNRILASAEGVSHQIEQITVAAEEVRMAAESMVKTIDSVSKVVEQNSVATEQMAASSDQVSRSVEGIAGITEQNSAATEESSATAEEMSAQVEEVVASSQSLTAMAEELQRAVIVFKLNKNGARDKTEVANN